MKIYIEDVLVVFPYEYIYPEQLEYMIELKRGLDKGGHIVLEMPSGTGKTISLLSLLLGYIRFHAQERRKVVYCTRTVEQMIKVMGELRNLLECWKKEGIILDDIRGVCLTAKVNLCIESSVTSLVRPDAIDEGCRRKTAPWVRENRCIFFDKMQELDGQMIPAGVYSVEDLKQYGLTHTLCPYYVSRCALEYADIIIHSYLYMVDPIVSEVIKSYLHESSIIVMDEGHNIDDVCIEALSIVITQKDTRMAKENNIHELTHSVEMMKGESRRLLQEEYEKLVNRLALTEMARQVGSLPNQSSMMVSELPIAVANESIPGVLRQAKSFLDLLKKLADFLYRVVSRVTRIVVADPLTFLTKMKQACGIELKHLCYIHERLKVLMSTLQIVDSSKYRHIVNITHFFNTLALNYTNDRHELPGFVVIVEAFDPQRPLIRDPVLRLVCVDASLAVREVFSRYRSVVLTSGTLTPLDIYPKILGFRPIVSQSFQMTLSRNCISPIIVTRSNEQIGITSELTSSFKVRLDPKAQATVVKAYETLILDLSKVVPDGIVCFFTGYQYMNEVMLSWYNSGFLQELSHHKLVFVETKSVEETTLALVNYRKACDMGRGAIFFSIARGKIAEGIDFDHHYGRAVLMLGVPFLPPVDEPLRQRMHWMETCLGISESEFRNFDAMRQASQCIGRVLRNKTDYGLMLLVDRRFALSDKRKKLPFWIQQCLNGRVGLSIDSTVSVARSFCKTMAQPWDDKRDLGTSLLGWEVLEKRGYGSPSSPHRNKEMPHHSGEMENSHVAITSDPIMNPIRPVREPESKPLTKRQRKDEQIILDIL